MKLTKLHQVLRIISKYIIGRISEIKHSNMIKKN